MPIDLRSKSDSGIIFAAIAVGGMKAMKQAAKKRENKYFPSIFLILTLFALLAFSASPTLHAKDVTPPYLVNPIPEPGTITENWYFIRTGVLDDESGVNGDEDKVSVTINGSPPRVKPIIEPSYGQRGIQITLILDAQEKNSKIEVEVQAYDLAPEPNRMVESWSFYVHEISTDHALIGTYPEDYRSLTHSDESGNLMFSWVSMIPYEYYRLEFIMGDGSSGSMDFSAGSLETSYQTASFSAPGIPVSDWEILSTLGQIGWRVAPLNGINGDVIGKMSDVQYVTYIPENVPVLSRPYHNALLDPMYPPTFEWKALDYALDGYLVVFVRLDGTGGFSDDVRVFDTPIFVRTIPMDEDLWNTFSAGVWAWTVFGKIPGNGFSDFMIQRFTKN